MVERAEQDEKLRKNIAFESDPADVPFTFCGGVGEFRVAELLCGVRKIAERVRGRLSTE